MIGRDSPVLSCDWSGAAGAEAAAAHGHARASQGGHRLHEAPLRRPEAADPRRVAPRAGESEKQTFAKFEVVYLITENNLLKALTIAI